MGHVLQVHRDYTSLMGRGQAILHDSKTGLNLGASDPRADVAAIPEQPKFWVSRCILRERLRLAA